MNYIFRLHNEGDKTLRDWGVSTQYGTNVIDQINDPNAASAKREITSIPSPFARIDLVKTAFGLVASGNVDGSTIHHKMVSDALDVGQIFFEMEKLQNDFDIIVWDKNTDLNQLLFSNHEEHRLLGETYKIFFQQDCETYNFDKMDRMYLLNYKRGPNMINIVGATSPATLFFTSANDLSYISENVRFGNNDQPFDSDFAPLYQRDIEYQKLLYTLAKTGNFARNFPEFNNYLMQCFSKLNPKQQDVIKDLTVSSLRDFQDVTVGGSAGNIVYILNNLPMKGKVQDTQSIVDRSGFLIDSNAKIGVVKPLVLPVEKYTRSTFYATGEWDINTKVPYYDPISIKDRILPDDGTQYPYLTISDFLTDTIIRMPYEIEDNNFFNGNIDKPQGYSYLLPLTEIFFHFFSTDILLTKTMRDGKKMFEMVTNAAGVSVILRIPVRSGYIEYRRTYFEATNPDETKNTNDGAVFDKKLGMGVMPLIKFPDNVNKHYRIALFDKGVNDIQLTCIKDNTNVETKQVIRKSKDLNLNISSSESYIVNDNFDRIKVKVGAAANGYIIPKFNDDTGSEVFTFAVDFGTTNTHIEYSTESNTNPIEFNIRPGEKQIHKLHKEYDGDPDIRMGFIHDFIPETIGEQDDVYSFPMRTVFSQHRNIEYDQNPMPLADGNIPFLYEKEATLPYNQTKTDLKWGGVNNRLLEMHLENLFILMRNKVVLNIGNLAATKIVWFYPASMTIGKINQFTRIWKKAYKNYFGEETSNITSISESTAPYSYYRRKKGARSEVVTIDIGGGTSDVYVVENHEPKMLLSFRYASNSIFGDSYNYDSDSNGFIKLYKDSFEEMLANNDLQALKQALNQIETQKKSSDIVAFLFSLVGDKVKNNPSLNFLDKLMGNDQVRYVFIVFYGSILYFIAKSMKARGLKKPLTLAFSGNGSHSLKIVSTDKETIAKFAELIFNGVYDDGAYGRIQVIMEEEPKKATCKGGILQPEPQTYEDIKGIKSTLIGDDFKSKNDHEKTYQDIDEQILNGVLVSVTEFFNFLFDLHKNNDNFFNEYLSADPSIFSLVKDICLDETLLSQSLSDGFYYKRKEVNDDTNIEETLFFYPFVGVLHDLALKISEL